MSKSFTVTLNNQTIHKYSEERIPGRLMRYLDEMESDMQKGIQLGDNWQADPSDIQKQQYVAIVLLDGLQKKDSNLVNVTSAYLLNRNESLSEINITQQDGLFNLDRKSVV